MRWIVMPGVAEEAVSCLCDETGAKPAPGLSLMLAPYFGALGDNLEAAPREHPPPRKSEWQVCLDWAIECFRPALVNMVAAARRMRDTA